MSADSRRGGTRDLTDRRSECGTLDRLIEAVQAGQSRALVVRGDPGIGKTVLLDYLAGRARGQSPQLPGGILPDLCPDGSGGPGQS